MAKKKHHKKHHRRRRSMGAFGTALKAGSPIVMLGSVALGYLAGDQINAMINMLIPASAKTQPNTGKFVSGGQVAVGALLLLGKGKKSMIKDIAGGLLAGAGLKRATVVFAANTTNTLGGYGEVPVIGMYNPNSTVNGRRRVNGYGQVPVIGGSGVGAYDPNSSLTGAAKVMGNVDRGSGINNGSAGASQYSG